MSYAVLFPGQGSQSVGMGSDVFAARPDLLGASADAILGWSLESVCSDGHEEELTRTDRAQPALFGVSFALWEAFASMTSTLPAAAAGHSLGEYTALAAAGALSFEDGLRLVAERGAAMAAAAELEPSGMAALLGADRDRAEALAAACRAGGGRLWIANLNAPGQVVVAGGRDDLDWAAAHAREHGVRRITPLKVAGAFHSPFMESAAAELAGAVSRVRFGEAAFPVWSNATAEPHGDGKSVAAGLVEQLTSPVRFGDSLLSIRDRGITTFVHIGPGDVTAGLVRRSIESVETRVVSTLEEAAEVAAAIEAG